MISRERLREIVREELAAVTETLAPSPHSIPPAWSGKAIAMHAGPGAGNLEEYNTAAAGLHANVGGFKARENWDDSRHPDITPDTANLPFEE